MHRREGRLAGKAFTVKPDKTDATPLKFDDKTQFRRLAAGETDTKKATRAAAPTSLGIE